MPNDVDFTTAEENSEESFVSIFSSSNHDGEMEAMTIKGILDASDISAMVVGPSVLPNLEFQVQVPAHLADRARLVVEEARAAGPMAAEEGELASENSERGL